MALNINIPSQVAQTITNGVTSTAPSQDAVFDALQTKENTANKGVANGYAPLNSSTKIDSQYLPSYVDDVIEVANYAALPVTGETGKIYITIDNGNIYRWSGSIYVQIANSGGVWGSISGTLSNQTDLQNALNAKFDDPTGTTAQYIRGDGSLATFPSLTGYVPYTGATTDVDLGTYNLTADHIALNTSPSGAGFVVGATQWNNNIGSSETLLKGGNVTIKNGVDLVARVVNNTGIQLTKAAYQVVKVSGAQGQRLAVGLAQANNDNNSADTLGIAIETIGNNQEGFIMTVGQIDGLNTTGSLQGETWVDGNVLYLSPTVAGMVTNIKPNGSNGHIVIIGYVEYAHANNGKIYIKIMNGWELDELHNVYINSGTLANNDILTYESSTQLWKNKTIATALGYTPANQTTTISTSSPLSGGGDLSTNRTLSISDAVADGATKGAATFTASDFNSASGVISIDYANGQSASASNKGFLTSTDWSTFNAKQDALVSGTNIKTLEGQSLLGSGNIDLTKSDVGLANVDNTSDANKPISTATQTALNAKQDTLVSGTNIKTVNSSSLLGSGNLSVGTVTNVSALTLGTTGTDLSSSVATGTSTPVITLNVPTASATNRGALSSTDWSTFNSKQNALTLTTTGSSGAATLIGSTLNIPNYAASLNYFTEAQATSSPNNTVYVDSLTAVSSTTNADIAIIPKGTGALIGAIPDSLTSGGNKRGTYAVDWQLQRNAGARVASGANSTVIGGYNNEASGQYSISGGTSCQAQNTSAIALGQSSIASGAQSVAIGSGNNVSSTSGSAIGASNTVSGNYGVALGGSNSVSTQYSLAAGYSCTASGNQSVSLGYSNTSSGRASVCLGSFGSTFGVSERMVLSTSAYVTGGGQKSTFILSARTTSNTATTLAISYADSSTPSAANQMTLQNNNSMRFKGTIIGRQSGSTNTSAWDIDGIIQRGTTAATTTLLLGNVTVVQNTPAWGTPTLAANTTLGCLTVQVTGATTTNIQWTCVIDTTEVIYA